MSTATLIPPPEPVVSPPEVREVSEARTIYMGARPLTFEEFLALFGEDDDVELIDGVAVKRMAAQLDHERLFAWLIRLLGDFAEERNLGTVLGSRTAVRITGFRGRLPDLLFVRREREGILQQSALSEAPDLVIEIVSPGDRPSDLITLEADYRSVGVPQIVFVDLGQQTIRVLRRSGSGGGAGEYADEILHAGDGLTLDALDRMRIPVEALLADNRPPVRQVLARVSGDSGDEPQSTV